MALLLAALGAGYELGAALAGSPGDPEFSIAAGGGVVASAVGLWRVQCVE